MPGNADVAVAALNRKFMLDYPAEVAERLEKMEVDDAVANISAQPTLVLLPAWRMMAPIAAAEILEKLPAPLSKELLTELSPNEALQLLGLVDDEQREKLLANLDPSIRTELQALLVYPEETAGRLMDTRFLAFRGTTTCSEALDALRKSPVRTVRSLFLIDEENQLNGRATIHDIAISDGSSTLGSISQPVMATADPLSPQSELAQILETYKITDLPIVNVDGTLLGVVYHDKLVATVQDDVLSGMQTMVGASREERALSKPMFAVQKRMPWLQINLLTAFMAAAVVGLFQSTIAKYTALAVLLPVVAGQSGNAGAQALAVTMRGLALREISVRNWRAVLSKELMVGLLNGVAIAITCGIGVFIWSWSGGLVLIIMVSMVLAMVAAGFAGAIVPIVLTKLGQDPAQSSSIVLTTITDIAGFFSFLGIATMLAFMI